jgi:hypothetical protein
MNSTKEKIIEELKIPSSWEKEYKIVWDKFSDCYASIYKYSPRCSR